VTRRVTAVAIITHIAFDIRSIALKKGMHMTALSNLSTTVPFTQLTFVFPETETQNTSALASTSPESISPRSIPIGIAVPTERKKSIPSSLGLSTQRRNKPEHISDLLLVVLDRYGIDANEFMAGLE